MHFGPIRSNSVHCGPFRSSFVLFGPFRFSLVCFCLIRSISALLCLILFSFVHFGLFSPIRCILILFSLLWSFSVHFDALQYIYIYIYLEKREGILMFVIASHSMIHCQLDFLVSLWVPPVQSKVCHYSTSLL